MREELDHEYVLDSHEPQRSGGIGHPVSIVWHRGDLRTHDHPALHNAATDGSVIGLVILDDNILHATSARRRALFFAHVTALRETYRRLGSELYVRSGVPWSVLPAFTGEITRHAFPAAVHALRSFTPYGMQRDQRTADSLRIPVLWHDGLYVRSPGSLHTKAGRAFSVYSPYLAAWRAGDPPEPVDAPARLTSPAMKDVPPGDIPVVESDVVLPAIGEAAALRALTKFLDGDVTAYADARNMLDGSGSSRLSVCITIGALSARTAAAAAWHRSGRGVQKWINELAWRDFLADMLYHRPALLTDSFHPRWNSFAWNDSDADFDAWKEGRTGVPAVDAAMRELRATGWISNRARMIAAQFLTKHLRIHWLKGARVFHAWLLDGDVASNTGNWQWSAGLGIDNAPYFRVFNPVTQAKQHDPDGAWLRRWVPESNGDPRVMEDAIVDLSLARSEYLEAARSAGEDRA